MSDFLLFAAYFLPLQLNSSLMLHKLIRLFLRLQVCSAHGSMPNNNVEWRLSDVWSCHQLSFIRANWVNWRMKTTRNELITHSESSNMASVFCCSPFWLLKAAENNFFSTWNLFFLRKLDLATFKLTTHVHLELYTISFFSSSSSPFWRFQLHVDDKCRERRKKKFQNMKLNNGRDFYSTCVVNIFLPTCIWSPFRMFSSGSTLLKLWTEKQKNFVASTEELIQ